MQEINELREYHKNPRNISVQQFEKLGHNLMELGDLSGVIVNIRTGEVIGGNQRVKFFQGHKEACDIHIMKSWDKPTPTGTMALGFIVNAGEYYTYREVDWDEKTCEKANLVANRTAGSFNYDILGNEFDIELLKDVGFSNIELGLVEAPDLKIDTPQTSDEQQQQHSSLTLNFSPEQRKEAWSAIETLGKEYGLAATEEIIVEALVREQDIYLGN